MTNHYFDIAALAATLPDTAETMLRDIRLTDEEAASCRIFRTYRPAPMHFHSSCDEYLYVLSGRGIFVIQGESPRELGPGELVHFKQGTVHGWCWRLIRHAVHQGMFTLSTPRTVRRKASLPHSLRRKVKHSPKKANRSLVFCVEARKDTLCA